MPYVQGIEFRSIRTFLKDIRWSPLQSNPGCGVSRSHTAQVLAGTYAEFPLLLTRLLSRPPGVLLGYGGIVIAGCPGGLTLLNGTDCPNNRSRYRGKLSHYRTLAYKE
jgi:hypothetical protein